MKKYILTSQATAKVSLNHKLQENKTDISGIEREIISMHAKGMSNYDIGKHKNRRVSQRAVHITIGIDL